MNGESGMQKIECARCHFYLATVYRGEITIRLKEHFVYTSGGIIRIICPGCGGEVVYIDPEYEAANPEKAASLKRKQGVMVARLEPWVERKNFSKSR